MMPSTFNGLEIWVESKGGQTVVYTLQFAVDIPNFLQQRVPLLSQLTAKFGARLKMSKQISDGIKKRRCVATSINKRRVRICHSPNSET